LLVSEQASPGTLERGPAASSATTLPVHSKRAGLSRPHQGGFLTGLPTATVITSNGRVPAQVDIASKGAEVHRHHRR
jgi:hypothetical protein